MRAVTETPSDPEPEPPSEVPGERRLARAPSERYGAAPDTESAAPPTIEDPAAAPARGVAFGVVAAVLGAGVIVVLGGTFAISAGLLVAAAALGYAVALALLAGAGDTLAKPRRPWIAGGLALLGALLGQLGLWLYARSEGGVLAPIDYLAETFGALVPLELLLAAGVAWWRAR
jgi:hypothetical protein